MLICRLDLGIFSVQFQRKSFLPKWLGTGILIQHLQQLHSLHSSMYGRVCGSLAIKKSDCSGYVGARSHATDLMPDNCLLICWTGTFVQYSICMVVMGTDIFLSC